MTAADEAAATGAPGVTGEDVSTWASLVASGRAAGGVSAAGVGSGARRAFCPTSTGAAAPVQGRAEGLRTAGLQSSVPPPRHISVVWFAGHGGGA
eukprot:352798-Chlamydomonas_euryale.AAC.1